MQGDKLKVKWVVQDSAESAVANALGYGVHNAQMRKHCEQYFEYCDDAPIAVTITPADQFKRVPGKFNILFTMWEAIDVPASYIPGLRAADLVVVPCEFCREIFQPLTDVPVVTCFEGVDPNIFKFHERRFPDFGKGEKFRFLWLGAPNPRKGYFSVLELVKVFEQFKNVEIYFKTTASKKLTFKHLLKLAAKKAQRMHHFAFRQKNKEYFLGEWKHLKGAIIRYFNPKIEKDLIVSGSHKNIIFDSRKLSSDELVALYNSAHCFLSPHSGEGWGLTLSEAMATGCPSIASYSTGVKDFFDSEVGFPVECDIVLSEMRNYKINARVYVPDTRDFFNKALFVFQNYNTALKRAKKASYRMKTNFTWEKSARRFADIITKSYEERFNHGKSLSVQESENRGDHGALIECASV